MTFIKIHRNIQQEGVMMLLILEWLVKVELQIVVSNAWSKWTNSRTQEAPTLRLRFVLVNSRKMPKQ